MAKVSNPFEHQHDRVQDDAPLDVAALDPAQKSLADALRVSLLILKVIMAGLAIYYVFFSGLYNVKQNEKAVELRFGKISDWDIPTRRIVPARRANVALRCPVGIWFDWPAEAATWANVGDPVANSSSSATNHVGGSGRFSGGTSRAMPSAQR